MVDKQVKRWIRGVWMATVNNLDWPSRTNLSPAQQQKEWIKLLDQCQALKLNAIVVQVRPMADAFYRSRINPWSRYLTGTQGRDPGYDPLAFMIEEAHQRCLEFHAWFNPYRVLQSEQVSELVATHPARKHPEWLIRYGGKLMYDPGLPEVRQHIVDSIEEVMQHYAIDAVHFDDYFYPYPVKGESFPDDKSYQTHGAGQNRADWRRNNVDLLIQAVAKSVKNRNSKVKFGISPFGIWRNRSTDATGSDSKGLQSYDALYADTKKWVQKQWLDYIAPQLYWKIGYEVADYQKLLAWWVKQVQSGPVHLYIGQAAYRIEQWNDKEEIPRQLMENLSHPQVKGSLFFSLKDVLKNPLGFKDRLQQDFFRYHALVPEMKQLGGRKPTSPNGLPTTSSAAGVKLQWSSSTTAPHYYVVYRFASGEKIDLERTEAIIALVPHVNAPVQEYIDHTQKSPQSYQYRVTAVDRLHHESDPTAL